ncbi:MAG TPA: type II secretion system protein GspM [Burkholderiaceae bacterium]
MDPVREFWSRRAPREKLALSVAAAVAVAAIAYESLIAPAAAGVDRLRRSLPATRAQSARLEAMLSDARILQAKPPAARASAQDGRAFVERSLAAAGLKATRIVPLSNGDLQLTFGNVPYATWSAWLAQTERDLGARAAAVSASATSTPGNTDIELSLRLAPR